MVAITARALINTRERHTSPFFPGVEFFMRPYNSTTSTKYKYRPSHLVLYYSRICKKCSYSMPGHSSSSDSYKLIGVIKLLHERLSYSFPMLYTTALLVVAGFLFLIQQHCTTLLLQVSVLFCSACFHEGKSSNH